MERAKESSFSWIQRSLLSTGTRFDAGIGITVASCVPPIYPAYLKIFHSIFKDTSISDLQITWDEWEKSGAGKVETAYREATPETPTLMDATVVFSAALSFGPAFRRVKWSTLAERHGLLFHPEFNANSFRVIFPRSWPRYLHGPAEGYLELNAYTRLTKALSRFIEPQFVYVKMPDMWKAADDAPRVFRGAIHEVVEFLREAAPNQSPEYVWPEDRSWCVNSDYDLNFTLVGGASELIAVLIREDELESIEISQEMRVDYLADTLNSVRRPAGNA